MYKFITYAHTSRSTDSHVLRFVFCFSHVRQAGVSVCKSTALQSHHNCHQYNQAINAMPSTYHVFSA